jgi:iduronate 2-sulfatase
VLCRAERLQSRGGKLMRAALAYPLSRAPTAAALVAALCVPVSARPEPLAPVPGPNVLLIVIDDLRPELGSYGNALVKTPNIDRIASWGVRFDAAYAQSPLCNPSRSSMLTGRYPTQTGVWDNATWFGAAHPDFVSLPRYFREHGYITLRAGKIFHRRMDEAEAWSVGGEPRRFEGATNVAAHGSPPSQSDRVVALDGDGELHHDYVNATRAIELLEAHRNERFFLAVGLVKPHAPPAAPRKTIEVYAMAKISLPVDFALRPTLPQGFPYFAVPKRNSDLFVDRDASPDEAREMIRGYYASISFTDANVGRVLAALDRLGLRDETLVALWSDHGYHLGEKGKWSKHDSLFEVGTRVPLIIAPPGSSRSAPKASPRVVQSLDIYPTLVDLCGLPRPLGIEGRSLRPLLDDPMRAWDHPAYTLARFSNGIAASVRTERWRYAEWSDGQNMLFDHRDDPHETRNLAQEPAYAAQVRQMRGLLVNIPRWGLPASGSVSSTQTRAARPD